MTLEKLNKAMILAMKAHDKERKDAIAAVIGAVKKAAIDRGHKEDITEALVDEMLLKEVKTVKEMIDTCPDARADLKAQYTKRLAIVEEFAPKLIADAAEIEKVITATGFELIKANRGNIMKALKGAGVDMKAANGVLGKLLI